MEGKGMDVGRERIGEGKLWPPVSEKPEATSTQFFRHMIEPEFHMPSV